MIPGVAAAAGSTSPPDPPARVQRAGTAFGTSVTLPGAPTTGNTLLFIERFPSSATPAAPTGFTLIASHTASTMGVGVSAKVSDASETTVTGALGSSTAMEYAEWTGLAAVGSLYDGTNSIVGGTAASTSWDPASTTGDQANLLYLPCIAWAGAHGGIATPWTNTDGTNSANLLSVGRKAVGNQAAFDTDIAWTTSTLFVGIVAVLRGLT